MTRHGLKSFIFEKPRLSSSACKSTAKTLTNAGVMGQLIVCISTGATKVKGFSHEVRSAELSSVQKVVDQSTTKDDEMISLSPPAMYAHIDNSPAWASTLFRNVFGAEEAERLAGCRWAIINAWRPIKLVARDPLGVCDTQSVSDDDLVPVYAKFTPNWGNSVQDFTGHQAEIYNVKSNPLHRWYFASAMQPDEVLLITNFDTNSNIDGNPIRCVHSAFPYKSQDAAPPRESIELRTLVVWEDQKAKSM